jgi:hypothetical protein
MCQSIANAQRILFVYRYTILPGLAGLCNEVSSVGSEREGGGKGRGEGGAYIWGVSLIAWGLIT